MPTHHPERHTNQRTGWLRAAVLGANDGIVSTASLLLGVAAADVSRSALFATGAAALAAGALSMAVGEYVSVSSQRDSEDADIARERYELERFPRAELDELTGIYVGKGLSRDLARQVAVELSKGDQLAVHLADELGITEVTRARPILAALASAAAFTAGALVPVLTIIAAPTPVRALLTAAAALAALAGLGALSAHLGGARRGRATVRCPRRRLRRHGAHHAHRPARRGGRGLSRRPASALLLLRSGPGGLVDPVTAPPPARHANRVDRSPRLAQTACEPARIWRSTSTISRAVWAASSPLLSPSGSERTIACSRFSVVRTPNTMGTPVSSWACWRPVAQGPAT